MTASRMSLALALLALLAACGDRPTPSAPSGGEAPARVAPTDEHHRLQRLARALARSLDDPAFRADFRARLERSALPEGKVHFQGALTENHQRLLAEIARLSGSDVAALQADAAAGGALEIYLPVPAHRAAWRGDGSVLVATLVADGDIPVAFDTRGNRHLLDPRTPPARPVIGLVPAETDFQPRPARADCTFETCPGGGDNGPGGGGGPPGSTPAPGLYMTYSHVNQLFESWLKGSPEFEVHVLGQLGQTDSLKDYQCAGEHAGGPYTYDQNGLDWTGSVLLYSQAQLDNYKAQHPGQSIRVFMLEDDDTACDIRTTSNSLESILAAVDAAHRSFTGGRDSVAGLQKFFQKATALQKLLQKVAAIIKTSDELVGNAVEDVVVGQYYPGANWIIKGQNNVTNGWIKLVMR